MTALTLASQPGDWIGQGQNYTVDGSSSAFNVTQNGGSLTVQMPASGSYWFARFEAPTGQTLAVGTYADATRFATATKPGLDVTGQGRGSNGLRGRFIVKELTLGPNSTVTSAHIIFEQYSEGGSPGLFGELRINSEGAKLLGTRIATVSSTATMVSHTVDAGTDASNFSAQGLPDGLSINSATGEITGPRPATYGGFLVTVSATRNGEAVEGLLALAVAAPPNVTSIHLTSDTGDSVGRGRTYFYDASSGSFRGFNNVSRQRVEMTQADLGGSDAWSFEFGTADGTPLTVGTYANATSNPNSGANYLAVYGNGRGGNTVGSFRVNEVSYGPGYFLNSFSITFEQRGINSTAALRGTVRFKAQSIINAPSQLDGALGSPFQYAVTSNNNATQFQAQGLPTGLSLDPVTGVISGTPQQSGYFLVNLSAMGPASTATYTVTLAITPLPPRISSASIASGQASQPFSFQVAIENNPTGVTATGLPAGLTISSTGLISGIPTYSGHFEVTVTASNPVGTGTRILPLTIAPQERIVVNVSTRLKVQTGEDLLIGGFVIAGPVAKRVLVRGTGPSLTGQIAGPLADPNIELRNSAGGLIASNDNWRTQTPAVINAIINSGFAPTHDAESAIIRTLDPGAYTVLMRGQADSVGVGLVEVYDLDSDASALVNISTRGRVEGGENVMIGGFVVGGSEPVPVLVRATGPSLTAAGIEPARVLLDPTLEIRDDKGFLVATSDNWREGTAGAVAAIAATPFAPSDDREPAVYLTLSPGAYTAVVRGKNGTAGVALVEVYKIAP